MTRISIIVAVAHDGAIGRQGDLLFHISDDLRRFKAITMGHPIIMGRKTFESFPKGALPGRRNIVITRQADYTAPNIEVADSLDQAIDMASDAEEAFVIGGGEIYRQAIDRASRLFLTEIDAQVADADTFFPAIPTDFHLDEETPWLNDPHSGVAYRFVTLSR